MRRISISDLGIIAYQDRYAQRKKAARIKDIAWMDSRQAPLIEIAACEVEAEDLALCNGLPRMHPMVAYEFLWVRGILGSSLKNSAVRTMLQESLGRSRELTRFCS